MKHEDPAGPALPGFSLPYAPLTHIEEFRREMRLAEASHQITMFSYAQHSFTDADHDGIQEGIQEGIAFHPLAFTVSWAGTLAMLHEIM